jgi:hypothetical protein
MAFKNPTFQVGLRIDGYHRRATTTAFRIKGDTVRINHGGGVLILRPSMKVRHAKSALYSSY